MKTPLLTLLISISLSYSFGQKENNSAKNYLNIDANLNVMNKTRSYAVLDPNEKFANSPFFLGFDASVYYQVGFHQVGLEIYPYLHTNAFYGLDVFNYLGKTKKIKFVPEIKYGYSWVLEKQYTGLGIKVQYNYWNLKVNRMLHIKSGESNYWGDGITGVSLGFTFNKNMIE